MDKGIYKQIVELSHRSGAQKETLQYLTYHLTGFLKKGERVLICFYDHSQGNLGWLMEKAVLGCGAIPVVWEEDRKWKTLLRQAFLNKASVIIGEPLILLGLTKLMKNCATPLYIRRVITAGYPCPQWMIDGIAKGFDCVVGGCFSLGTTGVVAGFACGRSWGVHLREDTYGVEILDKEGKAVEDGQLGNILLYPLEQPQLRISMGDRARLEKALCPCECRAPRLMDFVAVPSQEPQILALSHELLNWTSILDCWIQRGEYGLEVDIVAFPGEKLPKLPSAARMNLQYLDLEVAQPFQYYPHLTNPAFRY